MLGEGKIDAFAAVTAAPKGPTGTLAGTVRRVDNMSAIGGAEVHVTGPGNRGVATNPAGQYSMLLPVGTYTVTVSGHGYAAQTVVERRRHRERDDDEGLQPDPGPALEHNATTLTDPNGNGKVEPGETFQLDEQLENTGHATATGVSATLSTTTPGIEITQATASYPDIPEGALGTNTTQFAGVATAALPCGNLSSSV